MNYNAIEKKNIETPISNISFSGGDFRFRRFLGEDETGTRNHRKYLMKIYRWLIKIYLFNFTVFNQKARKIHNFIIHHRHRISEVSVAQFQKSFCLFPSRPYQNGYTATWLIANARLNNVDIDTFVSHNFWNWNRTLMEWMKCRERRNILVEF